MTTNNTTAEVSKAIAMERLQRFCSHPGRYDAAQVVAGHDLTYGNLRAILAMQSERLKGDGKVERLVELLTNDDHKRLCEGRQYSCTCGYDVAVQEAANALAALSPDNREPGCGG